MKRLPLFGVLLVFICLISCRRMNDARLLHLAEEQVEVDVDSIYALLSQIENPSQLSGEERLLYGWLNTYRHYKWGNSMMEDSLILPAADYYASRNDTSKTLLSYQLKAWYWHWQKKYGQCMAAIDSGIALARSLRDTGSVVNMLGDKAAWHVYVWKEDPFP